MRLPDGGLFKWRKETCLIIIDRDGFLAGAAIYGSEAGTWIDFLTLIINKKISGEELRNMIFAFPTQTYMLVSTLIPLMKKAD